MGLYEWDKVLFFFFFICDGGLFGWDDEKGW